MVCEWPRESDSWGQSWLVPSCVTTLLASSSPRISTRCSNWVLACQLVATTPGRDLPLGERTALRRALREERWGDAVFAFIARTGIAVDVYESTELHTAAEAAIGPLELQLTPLFTD